MAEMLAWRVVKTLDDMSSVTYDVCAPDVPDTVIATYTMSVSTPTGVKTDLMQTMISNAVRNHYKKKRFERLSGSVSALTEDEIENDTKKPKTPGKEATQGDTDKTGMTRSEVNY